MDFVKRFETAIEKKGMTFSGFARKLGYTPRYLLNTISAMRSLMPHMEKLIEEHEEGSKEDEE